MKKFVFVHTGFKTPTKEIMDAWSKWFESFADKLVENSDHFVGGREISHTGTKELTLGLDSITGYTIINAESLDEAEKIAKGCPFITSIKVYETMSMKSH